MPSTFYGSPERYLFAPAPTETDIAALTCALWRADAVCKLLSANFNGTGDTFNNEILTNACWALDGLISQALIIAGSVPGDN